MPIYKKGTEGAELQRKPRLPRLGIIRLGTLETGNRPDGSEYTYPHASDHFELRDAPRVAKVYSPNGENVTVLEPLIIPVEDEDVVAAHYLRMYGSGQRLLCIGDNNKATRRVDADKLKKDGDLTPAARDAENTILKDIKCPCPFLDTGQCKESLYFRFVLPNVPGVGVFQLRTTSYISIESLQGCMAVVRALAGHVAGIPLKLSLEPKTIHSQGRGGQVTVYVLNLEVSESVDIPMLAAMGDKRIALPAAPELAVVIDADYDNEENEDPELQEFTPKQVLEEAAAERSEETLTEADFVEPPARDPAETALNTEPGKSRRADPMATRPTRKETDALRESREALSTLVKEIVPADKLSDVPGDLAGWFNGRARIVLLNQEELTQAATNFKEKYTPAEIPAAS